MNLLLYLGGLSVILIAIYDLNYTTFTANGAGPVTSRLTILIWELLNAVSKFIQSKKVLNAAGVIIICCTLVNWVLLLWCGSALLLISEPESVLHGKTMAPAGNLSKVYFAGYVLSTMGNGDYTPGTDAWKIFTALISFSGLVMITIAVTYIVPVISAYTARRSLSIELASLGNGPQDILLRHWNGKNFEKLEPVLQAFVGRIAEQGQQQLAYPVLHYFYASQKHTALLPNLVALDEALTILLLYTEPAQRPGYEYLSPVRTATTSFLESITGTFVNEADENAPPIKTDALTAAGISLKQPKDEAVEKLTYRRHILKRMINNDGWEWQALTQPSFDDKYDIPFRY